jgi:NAD(P)-dependent dehydrogenase (short-subunit alcohol dehydrogenase family)
VIIAERDARLGQETQAAISEAGGTATFIQTDVTSHAEVESMVHAAVQKYGRSNSTRRIDILVNNAGVLRYGYLADFSEQDWDLTVDSNLKGTFLCTKAVLPIMMEQKSGAIINISSSAARGFTPEYPAYVAAKIGVLGLTQALAQQVRSSQIAVFAVCPGRADTPLGRRAFEEVKGRPPEPEDIARLVKPEDIANVVLHLAEPDMRVASGSILDLR